jgi:ABC-2 type transport system ATP-binding protein
VRCHGGKRFRRRKVPIDPLDSRGRHSTPMAVRRSSRAARCDATIEARDLSKRFGGTVAVDGLSFTVAPGRVTGFVGPNGAGKSTTMRLILGLDAPDGGSALLGGRPYAQLRSPLREVGALLDATALHPGRRADDHLLWLAQTGGLPRRRVGEVLEIVGLAPVARRRAGGFSLGMRQRLGIAAALLGDPPVLMLDEPVNGLDPEGIRWFRGFARELAAQGRAVFVSSHLMSELEDTADHLVVIGRGRLVADTGVAELLAAASGNRVVVRTPQRSAVMTLLAGAGATVTASSQDALTVSGLAAARVADLAAEHGLRLHELAPYHASLEEAFMELTRDAVDYRTSAPRAGRAHGAAEWQEPGRGGED